MAALAAAALSATSVLPGTIESIGRLVHGEYGKQDVSEYGKQAAAEIAELRQEQESLRKQGRQQSEASNSRLEQLQQEVGNAKKDLTEQPTDPFSVLRQQSREKYNIQEGSRHVQLTGTISAGKSCLGNALAGIAGESGSQFETGASETTHEHEARVSKRAELKGMVIHDCPGTGSPGNEPRKAVKELMPAGFDFLVIVMDRALMAADCSVITFCNAHKIPWAIVKSQMDLLIQNEAKEKVIKEFTDNVKRNLGLRNIHLQEDHLFFINAAKFDSGDFDEKALVRRLQAIK